MKRIVLALVTILAFAALVAYAGDPKPTCPMAKSAEGKAVEMTGKLLCKHCNLHQSESCEKVFQPSNDEKTLYAVCDKSKIDVEKVSEEGTALLHIKGTLVKCAEDGKEELVIDEATRVADRSK
jgi:hypothetical protein